MKNIIKKLGELKKKMLPKKTIDLMKGTRMTSFLFITVSLAIAGSIIFASNTYYDIDTSEIVVEEIQRVTNELRATTGIIIGGTASQSLTEGATLEIASGDFLFSSSGTITQSGSGQVEFTGKVNALGGLNVTGDSLTVGATNFSVATTGDVTFGGTEGATILADNQDLSITSSSSTGDIILTAGSGDITLGVGTNEITNTDTDTSILINPNGTGAVQFHSSSNYIDSTGSLVIDGDVTLTAGGSFYTTGNGNLVFAPNGDGNLVLGASGNPTKIIPFADSTTGYDIGASTSRWYDLYLKNQLNIDNTTLSSNTLAFTGLGNITAGNNTDITLTTAGTGKTRITNGTDYIDVADGTRALYSVKGATAVELADGTYAVDATGDIRLSGDMTITGGKVTFGEGGVIDNETDNLIKITSGGDTRIVLGDSAGVNQFQIHDSTGHIVSYIDSDGNFWANAITATSGTSTLGAITVLGQSDLRGNILNTTGNLTFTDDTYIVGNLDISGTFTSGTGNAFFIDASGNVTTTGSRILGSGEFTIGSGGGSNLILDSASGEIRIANGDTLYTEGGNPIRATGEEILKEMIPIFGFDLPIRCSTSCASPNYATTTRTIEDYPFAAAMAGTTRIHKFVIRYADSTTTASSTFRVRNVTDSTNSDTFEIPASSSTSLDSGNAYITPAVTIPTDTDDWKLDVQIPDSSMSLQIYQIFLAAYDQVD